jgi:CRISPR/Cas system CSM-associated protein Csm3 (group 7 of RAMP superfamily)
LVLLGIREVERGQMLLGGARSRGLGWVTLSVDEISRVDRDSLRRYLATGKAETLTDATRQTLVNTFLERVGGKDA